MIGGDGGLARFHGLEKIPVFHHTQALVPGIVIRGEMPHVGGVANLALDNAQEKPTHELRALSGTLV